METAMILTGTRFISSAVLSCWLVSMIAAKDIGKETRNIITARSSQNNYTACLKKLGFPVFVISDHAVSDDADRTCKRANSHW